MSPARLVSALEGLRLPDERTWLDLAVEVADLEGLAMDVVLTGLPFPHGRYHLWYLIRASTGSGYEVIAKPFNVRANEVFAGVRRHALRQGAPRSALAQPGLAFLPGLSRSAARASCTPVIREAQNGAPPPRNVPSPSALHRPGTERRGPLDVPAPVLCLRGARPHAPAVPAPRAHPDPDLVHHPSRRIPVMDHVDAPPGGGRP